MKKECRQVQKKMGEALYGEMDSETQSRFDAHLKVCTKCANQYSALQQTIMTMHSRTRNAPDADYWDTYWERLAPKLARENKPSSRVSKFREWFQWRSPKPAYRIQLASAFALVLIGLFIGKLIWSPSGVSEHSPNTNLAVPNTRFASVRERANYTLEKSKILLLAWANFDPKSEDTETLNLPFQKKMSQSLVNETGYLRSQLQDPADKQLQELLSDLEVILLQIANLEDEHDLDAVELVRSGVEKRAVLFKINLSQLASESRQSIQANSKKPQI